MAGQQFHQLQQNEQSPHPHSPNVKIWISDAAISVAINLSVSFLILTGVYNLNYKFDVYWHIVRLWQHRIVMESRQNEQLLLNSEQNDLFIVIIYCDHANE